MFVAKSYLAGLVAGLVALSIAGATVRPHDLIDKFNRVHAGFESRNFYVTARELRSIVESRSRDDKVTVIVGGTSIFQGTSQSEHEVWTQSLQAELGDGYEVVNLALRAGHPNDFGNIAAELLLKQRKKSHIPDRHGRIQRVWAVSDLRIPADSS